MKVKLLQFYVSKKNFLIFLLNFFLITYFVLISIYATIKINEIGQYNNFYYYCILISLVFILLIFLVSFYFRKYQSLLILIIYSIIISVYSFELFITFKQFKIPILNNIPLKVLADKKNLDWDKRTPYEFYNDLKTKNPNLFPNYYPSQLLEETNYQGLKYQNDFILPLGGISDSYSFMGNELGFYPVFKNDKFGFKNDNNDYSKNIDFVLIGDSFIEGCCTKFEDTISANLQKKGYKTLSFGKSGAGPLTEFAIVREYLNSKIINYKNLIWFFYPNDVDELKKELNSNILKRYLDDDNFNQGLASKQEIINNKLKEYILIKELEKYEQLSNSENQNVLNENPKAKRLDLINLIKLYNVRNSFNLHPNTTELKKFEDIIYNVKNITHENEANFIFVYIPHINKISSGHNYQYKKFIFQSLKDLDIKPIDLTVGINNIDNPLSLWPFECCGHFNEKGTKLVSDILVDKIKNTYSFK